MYTWHGPWGILYGESSRLSEQSRFAIPQTRRSQPRTPSSPRFPPLPGNSRCFGAKVPQNPWRIKAGDVQVLKDFRLQSIFAIERELPCPEFL
jgi:hypothetical protein